MNIKLMYEQASEFREAFNINLCMFTLKRMNILSPIVVNGIFACEIYLKIILQSEKKKANGHELKKLFDNISLKKNN